MMRYKVISEKLWRNLNQELSKLNSDTTSATKFVREIERGNLDVSIGTNTTDSELKTSLVNMRDQFKKYSLTEKQRTWVNEGLARFVQILRTTNNEGRQALSDNIIRNLVVYLKANQGVLFVVNDDNDNDISLELEACYAYERKRFVEKRIGLGEGLAGQVVLEKATLYMTDVPKDFVKITSGLGEALPRNILLVPLKLDENVYGVVEIASFQHFESYEIEFVERLGESIASAIAAVKNSDRTRNLLKETQLQAEQLKAQEEEVRQNLEELSATQEAMQRAMKEVERNEAYASQLLNASSDLIYTVNKEFRFVMWNKAFADTVTMAGNHLKKGAVCFEWDLGLRASIIEVLKLVFAGENIQNTDQVRVGSKVHHFASLLTPLRNESGEIVEAAVFSKNITELMEAQHESSRLLKEAQQQAEQLKAQEEELRQNLEELSTIQEGMQRAIGETEAKEAYISQIINTAQDVIYTVDREYRMCTWNSAFDRAAERINVRVQKGMNAFEWSAADRQNLIVLFNRALDGETFEHTYEIDIAGKPHHFLSLYAPIKSASGDIIEAGVYAKDITAVVEAQQEANRHARETQKREEYLSQLLNASRDVLFSVNREFHLANWNEAFARTIAGFGVSPKKGMIAFGWRPEGERAHFVELFKRVFNGETFDTIAESKHDGKIHQFHSTFTPLKNNDGEIIEALAIARDITSILLDLTKTSQQNNINQIAEQNESTDEKIHPSNGKR